MPQGKIAYHNQDIAAKRLQGDKNARFKQVTRRTPALIRGLIQSKNSGRTNQQINQNRISSARAIERETTYGGGVFSRHTNGNSSEGLTSVQEVLETRKGNL